MDTRTREIQRLEDFAKENPNGLTYFENECIGRNQYNVANNIQLATDGNGYYISDVRKIKNGLSYFFGFVSDYDSKFNFKRRIKLRKKAR